MSRTSLLAGSLLLPLLSLAGPAGPADAADDPCAAPTLVGTPDDDTLTGTPGPDVIAGLGGFDTIDGGAGDDVLCGGDGVDLLRGGAGDDRLYGGRDVVQPVSPGITYVSGDTLNGGAGDDLLDGGPQGPQHGRDIADFSASPAGVRVDLTAGTAVGEGVDTLAGTFSGITGSEHADVLLGSPRADELVGRGGADRLVGRGGDDSISTGAAPAETDAPATRDADVVSGGPGRDEIHGSDGDEALRGGGDDDSIYGRGGVDRILGGGGTDFVTDEITPAGTSVIDPGGQGRELVLLLVSNARGRLATAEQVRGRIDLATGRVRGTYRGRPVTARLRDVHEVSSPQGRHWTVLGTSGRDRLSGRNVRGLTLDGRGGNDVLTGSAHADLIIGGPGRDTAFGGRGRDVFRGVERSR